MIYFKILKRNFYYLIIIKILSIPYTSNGQCNLSLDITPAYDCFEVANSAMNMGGNGFACDFDGFCINTQQVPAIDPPIPFCDPFSVLNNPIWFTFLSDSSSFLDIEIIPTGCTGGLQWALYDNCGDYYNTIACQGFPILSPNEPFDISRFIQAGVQYYLVIDGENGSSCNLEFNIKSGIAQYQVEEASDTILTGNINICPTEFSQFSFDGFPHAKEYTWSINGNLISTTLDPEVNYSFPGLGEGSHQLCVTGTNDCDVDGQSLCWELMVTKDQTITENRNVCAGDSVLFQNTYYTTGTYTINYVGPNTCIEFIELNVNDYILPVDTTFNAIICNDLESFEYSGIIYELDTVYENVPFQSIFGCTYYAKLLVSHLDTSDFKIYATISELSCNSPISSNLIYSWMLLPNVIAYDVKWYNNLGQQIGAGNSIDVNQPGDYYAIFTQFYSYQFGDFNTGVCETRVNYRISNLTEIVTDPVLAPGLQTPATGDYEVKITNPENYPAGTDFIWIVPSGTLYSEIDEGISLYLPVEGTYRICVYAQDDCSSSDTSCFDVIVDETLSSGTPQNNHFVKLRQNPVGDFLIMDLFNLNQEQFNIKVFDINGYTLKNETVIPDGGEIKLGVGELQPGVYIYQITNSNEIIKVGKFVKL